jgi:hypothetical protein
MIQVTRVLTFNEYVTSNRITLLHSTPSRRLAAIISLYVLPIVGVVGVVLTVWQMNRLWAGPGNGAAFGFWSGVLGGSFVCCFYRRFYRRKLRRLYKQQELHEPWTISVDKTGVQSIIPGKADTRLEWAFFDRYVETPELFTLIQSKRPTFITLPKSVLGPDEQAELRQLLSDHVKNSSR